MPRTRPTKSKSNSSAPRSASPDWKPRWRWRSRKLHREHKIPLTRIVELFTAGPARVFDLRGRGSLARGSFADVTIFDPKKRWTFEAAKSRSLSHNTPFDGWQFTGKVVATIVGGKIVYQSGIRHPLGFTGVYSSRNHGGWMMVRGTRLRFLNCCSALTDRCIRRKPTVSGPVAPMVAQSASRTAQPFDVHAGGRGLSGQDATGASAPAPMPTSKAATGSFCGISFQRSSSMWLLLRFRWSARMRNLAERITRFRALQTALYWIQFMIVAFCAHLSDDRCMKATSANTNTAC